MKKMMILGLILLAIVSFAVAQEAQAQNVTNEAQEIAVKMPMAWQLPTHMREALQVFLNQKVEEYKTFLRANVKGFEEMPENVVFDFASGLFITPEGIAKLQEQQKQEVKKDEIKK